MIHTYLLYHIHQAMKEYTIAAMQCQKRENITIAKKNAAIQGMLDVFYNQHTAIDIDTTSIPSTNSTSIPSTMKKKEPRQLQHMTLANLKA